MLLFGLPFIVLIKDTTLVVVVRALRKTSLQKLAAMLENPEAPMKRRQVELTFPGGTCVYYKLRKRDGD